MKQVDRTELVLSAQRGNRESMELLIKAELPWIRAVLIGYMGASEAVDDVCQEVFLSAWQAIGSLRRAEGFRAWLYRIAINKVRSFLRSRRRDAASSLPEELPVENSGEDAGDREELLRAALARLSPEYRDPLVIHYLQGRSCAETAKILGLRPVTARIRLLRGRRQLQEILRGQGAV